MTEIYYEEEEFESQVNGKTLARIFAQVKPYWKRMLVFLLGIGMTAVLDGYFTFLSKRLIYEGIVPGNKAALYNIAVTFIVLVVVQACFVFIFILLVIVLGEQVRYDLRKVMFNHLQDLSLAYYGRTPVGWIMSRVTSDSDRVADLVTWGTLDSTWAVMNILTTAYFMLVIDWRLALMVLGILPVLLYIAFQFRKKILVEYRRVRKINSKITGAYNENITGVRVVKALSREDANIV